MNSIYKISQILIEWSLNKNNMHLLVQQTLLVICYCVLEHLAHGGMSLVVFVVQDEVQDFFISCELYLKLL